MLAGIGAALMSAMMSLRMRSVHENMSVLAEEDAMMIGHMKNRLNVPMIGEIHIVEAHHPA